MVTGGAGFIGSHIVDAYLDDGHEVVVVDDFSTGRNANLRPHTAVYPIDVASPAFQALVLETRPDVISHHAAQTNVRSSVQAPLNDGRRNILASINVIDAAARSGVGKVIYASSGGAIYGEPEQLPCPETDSIVPDSPYGASKHTPEHYLEIYHRLTGLTYTTLRYANVYGPRQDPSGEAGVIAIFIGLMQSCRQVTINGTGNQERDFVFIEDVVRANLAALEKGDGEAINIGTGVGTSINQVFELIRQATGTSAPARYGPAKPGETFRIYLDITRAAQVLGWKPQVSLETGIAKPIGALGKLEDRRPTVTRA